MDKLVEVLQEMEVPELEGLVANNAQRLRDAVNGVLRARQHRAGLEVELVGARAALDQAERRVEETGRVLAAVKKSGRRLSEIMRSEDANHEAKVDRDHRTRSLEAIEEALARA